MTGAEGPAKAVMKSGEGDAATGAKALSPAPWLTAGDMAMSDLQRELPPEMRALPPKQQEMDLHTRLLKTQEHTRPFQVPAPPVPETVEEMVEVLSTTRNTGSP